MPASVSSASSGGLSQTSSQASAVQHLNKRAKAKDGNEETDDLLEEKKSFLEHFYMCMETLTAEKAFAADWRVNMIKIVLEGLTGFLVVFNPVVQGWDIDYKVWFWQIISWSTYHSAVAVNRDYGVYTNVMYLHVAVVGMLLAGLLLLALTLQRVQKSKQLKLWVKVLHFCMDVAFTVGFMTFFSVFTFMFNCDFESNGNGGTNMHLHYRHINCAEVPHLAHMIVGGIFALIMGIVACILAVADCEHDPLKRTWLASPSAVTRMKIVVAKMVIIICAVGINEVRRAPTIILWLAALYTWWLYFRQMPFYNNWVNISISSMWLGIAYTCSLLMVLSWDHRNGDPDFHYWMTWNVLKGIFPVMVGGACCHYAFIWYKMYWTRKFIAPPPHLPLRKIHKFEYPEDVEIMSRVIRKFDRDGVVDPAAVELADTIIRAGMQYFPNCPTLVALYASMLLEVRHEGPLTRTQLLNAMKLKPDLLDRYKIYCLAQKTKRLKESMDGTMDLQSYVEFKRNYRMLARVHKEALQCQRDFWKLFMHSKAQDATVRRAMQDLEASSTRAQMVYRKIMERYPNNGKVLKCYGKFLEEVKNDIAGAAKYYTEGNRLGSTDAIMNMDFDLASKKKNDFLVSMDMHEDAVVIIDAVGTILMISQGTTAMFGYSKMELENANVSMLMPQPFCQRHPSYLQRYTSTGEPHILDKVQEVVALHKDKFVFPIELGVTQLSGTGADCIFLGVAKAMPVSMENVRVWVAPNGVVLCADQQFSGLMGHPSEALVGKSVYTLLEDHAAGEAFNELCKASTPEDFATHRVVTTARMVGKYLPPIPCTITVKLGGTKTEPIYVWNVKRADKTDEMTMVCDTHGTITFATWDMAALLGMSTRKLVGSKLEALLPPPYNSMHTKWLQETPTTIPSSSCRAGVVVNLVNSSHVLVPVHIKVHQMEDQGRTLHVVRLTRAAPNALVEQKRVSLTCNLNGEIKDVEPAESQLFNWPVAEMKGRHIADVVDTFATWRQRVADQYYGGSLERCMAETGTGGVKLLLLGFMDQEQVRPGGSYRVTVKPPDTDFAAALKAAQHTQHQGASLHELLHNAANAAKIRAARPAIMLPEAVEVEGVPAVKVHLFKQDALTGYLEMDTDLNIRKADMWASLVLGWPSSMIINQKLHNLLHVPPNCRWEELMGIRAQMGGLKRVNRGTVTAPRAFIANHPDGGTMKVVLQGVSKSEGLGTKNRIEATLQTDVNYKGESPTIYRILDLDDDVEELARKCAVGRNKDAGGGGHPSEPGRGSRRGSSSSGVGNGFANRRKLMTAGSGRLLGVDEEAQEGEEGEEGEGEGSQGSAGSEDSGDMFGSKGSEGGAGAGDLIGGKEAPRISMMGAMMQGSDNGEEEEQEEDPKKKADVPNKPSDFVAQWVRTLSSLSADRPETPGSANGDSEGGIGPKGPASRVRPSLGAIDENGEELPVMEEKEEEEGGARGQLEGRPRGRPFPDKRSSDGVGAFGSADGAQGFLDEARASVEMAPPPPGSDWERQVADMPDEAAGVAQANKEKGKRPGLKAAPGEDQPAKPGDDNHSESSGGDGGTETDGHSATSGNSAHDEILVDFRRGRLLKKLIKLARGPSLMEPLDRLSTGTLQVLACVLVVHIICFAVLIHEIEDEEEIILDIQRHALAIQWSETMRFKALQSQFCVDAIFDGAAIPEENMCALAQEADRMADELQDAIEEYSTLHQEVYLGPDEAVTKMESPEALALWEEDNIDVLMYYDTDPPEVREEQRGIWEIGNRMVYSAREIAFATRERLRDFGDSRAFQFILQSENQGKQLFNAYLKSLRYFVDAALEEQQAVADAVIAILVVEAIVVLTLLHLYQLKLVVDVERARLGNILALVGLPAPILRIMHAKPVTILEDDSDDEVDEEEDGERKLARAEKREEERKLQEAELKLKQQEQQGEQGNEGHATDDQDAAEADMAGGLTIAGPSKKSARNSEPQTISPQRFLQLQKVVYYNGKALFTSWFKTFRLVLPLFLWQLAVLIVFSITEVQVDNMQGPLASVYTQMRVNAWFARTRFVALQLVTTPGDGKLAWKEELEESAMLLEQVYEVALYGNGGRTSSDFPFPVPAAIFQSPAFSELFFTDKTCHRANQGRCFSEDHPFYEATRNGLDGMMRRYLRELKLLAADDLEDVEFTSGRFDYIYQVGMYDAHEALAEAAQLYTDFAISRFSTVINVQIALLVITIALAVGYVVWVTRPYVANVKHEASYVAGLLSHTPKELDVTSHLRGALKP